jgi:hypothetical protein
MGAVPSTWHREPGLSGCQWVGSNVVDVTSEKRWHPRHVRGDAEAEAEYDALHEGVPPWLRDPLFTWLSTVINSTEAAWTVGMRLKLDPGSKSAFTYIRERVKNDAEFTLSVVDAALSTLDNEYKDSVALLSLNQMLDAANSVWETGTASGGRLGLVRRIDQAVAATAREAMTHGRAGIHLRAAWTAAYSRESNPSHAYTKSVRAVEAAARPIVTPKDKLATLGKMIPALRNGGKKWEVVLTAPELDSVAAVASMCELIHKAQLDRHGTDDEDVPLDVSLQEAQAAVHVAATLVQWFSTGAIRRMPAPTKQQP